MSLLNTKQYSGSDLAQIQYSKVFADVFQSYLECSDEVQAVVRDLVRIVKSADATEEERESALETIGEALFPCKHDGDIGIDLDVDYANGDPAEKRRVVQQMNDEEAGFGTRLTRVLEEKGMTQSALAAEIGIGQSAVSMIISRDCRPQKNTVEKIAKALKIAPEELWPGFQQE